MDSLLGLAETQSSLLEVESRIQARQRHTWKWQWGQQICEFVNGKGWTDAQMRTPGACCWSGSFEEPARIWERGFDLLWPQCSEIRPGMCEYCCS
jgi:hypothetical protein